MRVLFLHGPVAVCIAVALCGAAVAAAGRAFTIADHYRVQYPSGIDVSPDGTTVVYSLRSTDLPRARASHDLYSIAVAGGRARRLTWTDDADETSPAFSPGGRHVLFVSKRGEQKASQLWLLPTAGGEARALTELSTGVSDPVWAPDGKSVAFSSRVYPECGADDACNRERMRNREDGPSSAHLADDLLFRHWDHWSNGRVRHVLVVEVATGTVRDLTPGRREAPAWSVSGGPDHAFSPDGTVVAFTRNPESVAVLASSTNTDIWEVAVAPGPDGAVRSAAALTMANPAWDARPRYSPDGARMAYLAQARPGYESDLIRLIVQDRETGSASAVAPGFDNWVNDFAWLPEGDAILFSADVGGRTPLYVVSADGGEPRQVADFAQIDEFVPSPDGTFAFVVRRSVGEPTEIWRLTLDGSAKPLRMTTHNEALRREVDIRPAERMAIDVGDGRIVDTFVVKPHGFDPTRSYPLILNVHGGPQGQWADAYRGDWQVYPGAGYIVAFPNPSGSSGYGQAFTEEISGDWGGRVYRDLMAVTDHLESLPYVDGDRMAAMGWSYGGYMMNWFAGHTDRFKALANMMGLFDLRSFYLATEELWFPEWDLGGVPWESDLYERWNPANHIGEFKTPMLVVTGELDFRVPYTQGLMAFTAHRKQGVPSRLVVLPGSGHWPGWYDMALYYTAHLDWFHRYLGGPPPPWSVEDFVANAIWDLESGERIDPD